MKQIDIATDEHRLTLKKEEAVSFHVNPQPRNRYNYGGVQSGIPFSFNCFS